MSFFDKKEETLDLKLTPYGRYLLSKGKLMPAYYAFLDDDIIYDSDSANFTESNHEIKNRIIDETPSLKPHYTMNSVETTINDSAYDNLADAAQETIDALVKPYDNYSPLSDLNTKFLQNTIGTSDGSKKNAPYWDILNLRGDITKASRTTKSEIWLSTDYRNDIDTPSLVTNIPQIDVEIEYKVTRKKNTDDDYQQIANNLSSLNQASPTVHPDGTYIYVEEDELLSRIYERNAFEFDEAFDIQVLKYVQEGEGNTSNNWKPLRFLNRPKKIIKDILMDNQEQQEFQELGTTPDVVEYYFDIRVDEEIALKDICRAVSELEGVDDITLDLGIDIDLDCKDLLITPDLDPDPEYCEDVVCDDGEES
jgi:hypothetical protein